MKMDQKLTQRYLGVKDDIKHGGANIDVNKTARHLLKAMFVHDHLERTLSLVKDAKSKVPLNNKDRKLYWTLLHELCHKAQAFLVSTGHWATTEEVVAENRNAVTVSIAQFKSDVLGSRKNAFF